MQPPAQSSSPPTPAPSSQSLPASIRAPYQKYESTGDLAALDEVVLAILADFIPKEPEQPLAAMPGDTQLIDGLGFDSLAITEVVFFAEDLFKINITNEEIIQVSTLDDLRGFIRRKVAARAQN